MLVPITSVAQWTQSGPRWRPESIDVFCPLCSRHVTFVLQEMGGHQDQQRPTIFCHARCPGCNGTVRVWIIDPTQLGGPRDCKIVMYPPPRLRREPIQGSELIPTRVRKAYKESLDGYNAGLWPSTATSCRRTLEGVIKSLLPEDKTAGTLANQIRNLSAETELLTKPLITLSNSLREGGNLGAHFDREKDPDEETARAMLDLIEYLLEYLFTLPAMIEELNRRIASFEVGGERPAQNVAPASEPAEAKPANQ